MATPRGSATRQGRSVTMIAPVTGQNSQVINAGATGVFTFNITEPCVLGRLLVAGFEAGALTYDPVALGMLELTAFQLDADSLISGSPNAAVANADATQGISPFLGQAVDQRSTLTLSVTNRGPQNITTSCTIAVR